MSLRGPGSSLPGLLYYDASRCWLCQPEPSRLRKTNGRHRLYRGGNPQATAALYRAVIVRMRWHQPTINYVTRRTAEGLSKREIIRCLERHLAREIYHLLPRHERRRPEEFWGRMQAGLLNRQRWRTRAELANAIFEYIEGFHNAAGATVPSAGRAR